LVLTLAGYVIYQAFSREGKAARDHTGKSAHESKDAREYLKAVSKSRTSSLHSHEDRDSRPLLVAADRALMVNSYE
jgi:hypothetical protein